MGIFITNFVLVLISTFIGFIVISFLLSLSVFILTSLTLLSIGGTTAILFISISMGAYLAKRVKLYRRIFGTLLAVIVNIVGQTYFYAIFLDNVYFDSSYNNIQVYFPSLGVGDGFIFISYWIVALIVTFPLCLIFVPRLIRQQQSD